MSNMSRIWIVLAFVLASCASNGTLTDVNSADSEAAAAEVAVDAPALKPSASAVQVGDISAALATFLGPDGDNLILLPNQIDRAQLDFSVESLKLIDTWLAKIHTINKLQAGIGKAGELLMQDGRGDNSVTFAGLYLGEVIRANSDLDWKWERFDLFLKANPYFAEHYGPAAGLDTFVLAGPQGVATPINTALKRVVSGKEESVHYIGQLLLEEIDLRQAVSGQSLHGLDQRDGAS